MASLGVVSGEQASASDLMVQDATEGSMSRQDAGRMGRGKGADVFRESFCYLRMAGWYSIGVLSSN